MLIGASDARAAVDASTPEALIQTLSAEVLALGRNDPRVRAGDMNRITELVDKLLLPHADFVKTTRLAVGRNWRQASPEQQAQLVHEFEFLLIWTYAGATSKIGDQVVKVAPVRMAEGATDVVVHSEVINQGKPYQVDYRLSKTADGWKIYDVSVMGVWLIAAYQQQFASAVSQGGVAGLISTLRQRNSELAQNAGRLH